MPGIRAASSECNVTELISPTGDTKFSGIAIMVSVPNETSSTTVNVTTSPYSSWKLYSDSKCTKEISNKQLSLKVGTNYAYIKVTAADNTTTKLYYLIITREAISNQCDVIEVPLPNGALIGENTITANVPIATNIALLNVYTSKYASWKLYNDFNCTTELSNKQLNLNVGNNIFYIKVTAQDNITTKKYTLTITRSANDVTLQVKTLGQPFLDKGLYPANVWDMQVFNDKIYLGFGNSSNEGPSNNAGPIPIIYYDPSTGNFVTEEINRYNSTTNSIEKVNAVDEEQIDIYRVFNGKLYIPGHDSKESWDFGNYYVKDNNGWHKYRNIPNGVHVFDIAYFKGNFFTALGTNTYVDENNTHAKVLMSHDGNTWVNVGSIPGYYGYDGRVYTLFEFKNKLYAIDTLYRDTDVFRDTAKILRFEQDSAGQINTNIVTVNGSKMVPGVKIKNQIKMVRTIMVNDKLLFIAGQTYNDQQWLPAGLYVSTDINSAKRISLPEQDALAMDTLVRSNTAYLLAYIKKSTTEYTNIVYKSDDLNNWTEIFRFNKDTFARSFEELNGYFYFGLGCNTDYLPSSTGTVLMVKNEI